MFVEMMAQIRRNVIYSVYQFQPKRLEPKVEADPNAAAILAGQGAGASDEEGELVSAQGSRKGSRKKGGK